LRGTNGTGGRKPLHYKKSKEEKMMTKRELFTERLETTGDFWRVCQDLVNEGWSLGDFEDAGIREEFQGFNNPVEENMEYLKKLIKIQDANTAGATWMETGLTECENPEEWLGMNYQEFLQAAANATRPAFPAFSTTEETDAAYHGAWAQLEFSRKLFAEDAIYQEDLNRRKTEGWREYDGK